MWKINMIFCVLIGFGSFVWALRRTMAAEVKKGKK